MADLKNLTGKTWIGLVEDNKDPKRLGRVKVRVVDVFDDLELESIPWATPRKDLNGNAFNVPDEGKVISVIFEESIYYPEYIYAQHHNINLQKKLAEVPEEDYLSMRALIFDEKTQIYRNNSEGLIIDHKFHNINITDSNIDVNLKDNNGTLNLGDAGAGQQAVLGNHWMEWFDKFVDNLLGNQGGPYIGNLGAPTIPNPALIQNLLEYKAIRETFLSDHVNIVDDNQVAKKDRIADGQIGDAWKSTIEENKISQNDVNYKPVSGSRNDNADSYNAPSDQIGKPSNPALDENIPDPNPASLEEQPELQKVIEVLQRKEYKIFKRAFEPNIVSVRTKKSGDKVTNLFDETMHYFFTDQNADWVHRKFTITTVPGLGKKDKDPKTGKKFTSRKTTLPVEGQTGRKGGRIAVLAPGQYLNYWTIRKHHSYEALGQIGKGIAVIRQKVTDFYDFSLPITQDGGGINMHRSMPYKPGQPTRGNTVYNWSEGCQVFKIEAQFNEFMKHNRKFRDTYGQNNFSYSLLQESDFA